MLIESGFVLDGAEIAEGGVEASAIIEGLYIIKGQQKGSGLDC